MIEDGEMKPAQQKVVLDKYFRAFLKWALKLSLEDKLMLAKFLRTVQAAHTEGAQPPAEPESPAAETERPALILPGLGGGSFIAHQEAVEGATYGGLDAMIPKGRKPQ